MKITIKPLITYLLKNSEVDFIQDHCHRCRDPCNGVLQQGKEISLNSEYNEEKWEFIAKEQGEGSADGKLLRGNIGAKGDSG